MCDSSKVVALNRYHRIWIHFNLITITFHRHRRCAPYVLTLIANSLTILMRKTAQDWCFRWENSYTFYNLREKELYSFVWQFRVGSECQPIEREKERSISLVVRLNITNVYNAGAAIAPHRNMQQWPLYVFAFCLTIVSFVVCGCTCAEALSKHKLNRTKTTISKRTFRKKKKSGDGVVAAAIY